MNHLSSTELLRQMILQKGLELKQKEELLIIDIKNIFENLKPINLIRSTLRKTFQFNNLIPNLFFVMLGLASSVIDRKLHASESKNPFKKIIGNVLKTLVANLALRNIEILKNTGNQIIDTIFANNQTNSEPDEGSD